MTIDPVNAIPRPPQLAAYRSDKGQAMNIEFRAKPTDIAVVGAGIIGFGCALALQRTGRSVTVIESIPPNP